MNILHINFSEPGDGAGGATAMSWLQKGLSSLGHESQTLCKLATANAPGTSVLPTPSRSERILRKVCNRLDLPDVHRWSTFQILKMDCFRWADVINLHIIHHDYFSYLALPRLCTRKPVVFTVHDMWPVTGTKFYMQPDEIAGEHQSRAYRLKQRTFAKSNMVYVAPSRWLTDVLKNGLPASHSISHVPYGIDLDEWTAHDDIKRRTLRRELGISDNRVAILVSAANLDEHRKGLDLFCSALHQLPKTVRKRITIMTMGHGGSDLPNAAGVPILNFGFLTANASKALVYSIADAFVLPTRADNQPCTILESLACGTPVMGYSVGGVPEVVIDGVTGERVSPESSIDLSNSIASLANNPIHFRTMRDSSRAFVEQNHDIHTQAATYENIFTELASSQDNLNSVPQ